MTSDDIRRTVLEVLARIAPEIAPGDLRPGDDIRETADIDSVDFLNFVVGLHERLGVDVPERDYAAIRTLDGCVAYLAARVGADAPGGATA
jgi:acyl carrier protein